MSPPVASNPRDWRPEGKEAWRDEADNAGYRRRSKQISTLIKWGWVAAFVIVGIAILSGAL